MIPCSVTASQRSFAVFSMSFFSAVMTGWRVFAVCGSTSELLTFETSEQDWYIHTDRYTWVSYWDFFWMVGSVKS